jgi:hypothetical protein
MNRKLFLAILSMDSYNRGYGEGVTGLLTPKLNPDGTPKKVVEIGKAQISGDSVTILGPSADAAGFYAIAYDVSQMKDANGDPLFGTDGTVIAYRGTDGILGGDLLYGWTLGGGGVDFRPAMLVANRRAVAANDNQPDAGLQRAFRSGSNDDRQCRKFLLTPWT